MENVISNPEVENYIESQPDPGKERLKQIQRLIKERVANAQEELIYGMPTFTLNGQHFIHYASGEKHTVLYPGAEAIDHFRERLISYSPTSEAIHLPFRFPLPMDLILEIILFRMKEI